MSLSAVAADPVTGAANIAEWNPDNYVWVVTRTASPITGKPAGSDKGTRCVITIVASNNIGHPASKNVTIRMRQGSPMPRRGCTRHPGNAG
jgi:hypothetical protein